MARGGVVIRGATERAYELTEPGTAGQVLTSNGADADPTFQGAGSAWVPLAVGTEPLAFVSDGAGQPIFVSYTP